MKRLGLIGGMSWESTATYYQLLNEGIRNRMGGLHSAELLLWSFDFAEIEALQAAGDWQRATTRMIEVAKALEHASADALLICTNTMHRMAEAIEESCDIPLLHIADATAVAIKARDSHNPLLLGTRFTMEQDFYKGRLLACHGIDVRIPEMDDARASIGSFTKNSARVKCELIPEALIRKSSSGQFLMVRTALF